MNMFVATIGMIAVVLLIGILAAIRLLEGDDDEQQ